jgi:hypothetical protein
MVSVHFLLKENEPTPFVPQRRSCPILGQFADDDCEPQMIISATQPSRFGLGGLEHEQDVARAFL